MNRRIPQGPSPLEKIGLQTLLLGQEATLERLLGDMNDVRDQLGHPRVSILRGSNPDVTSTVAHAEPAVPQRLLAVSPAAAERKSKKVKLAVTGVWQKRQATLRLAGIKNKIQGMPSNALIAKAERKLRRLGIAIPDGTEPVEAAEPKKKTLNSHARKLIGINGKLRWDLARRAGFHPTTLPTNEMVAKARKILGIDEDGKPLKKTRTTRKQTLPTRKHRTIPPRKLKPAAKRAVKAALKDMQNTQRDEVHVPTEPSPEPQTEAVTETETI